MKSDIEVLVESSKNYSHAIDVWIKHPTPENKQNMLTCQKHMLDLIHEYPQLTAYMIQSR